MKFVEAVLVLTGMIIGAGMFGIPFSFAQAGFWLGAGMLFLLAVVMIVFHSVYGDIIAATPESHRVPGYVRLYLGSRQAALAWGTSFFGMTGTLLAYILLGATFLQSITVDFFSFSLDVWAVILAAGVAVITLLPLRKEALVNGIFTVLLIGFLLFLVVVLFLRADIAVLPASQWTYAFLPYGILLFALSGGAAIPDVVTLLSRNKKKVRAAIMLGTMLPALLYFFFSFAVVGVSGNLTSEEALAGLLPIAGARIVWIGSMVGILAVLTSFIVLSFNFQALLRLDLGISRRAAWGVATGLPFFFYAAGVHSFITVIGIVGALSVGVESALILATYHAMRRKNGDRRSAVLYLGELLIYAMIATGVLASVHQYFL